ncbi:AraC-like DNA-binding protein [Halanaerobium saccharolyticum]|uniref:AraC-like DNA-binding protein n=1 Tax=Halanaerobium saccharolyticum TaxID=43595 RepID=A0A4R7YQ81_9FIRM|nr:helix-turn-helix domain-containing protein [Halanaerobium saccharolyticum]RAK05465.1 AraC-like DNA-binding protein [Halanaerobium saccharolyticum]TDV99800.1 AraC-like DNA-binding protein [Halanaerobium saccharolyticum]TDX52022.1 AraC-like DNA-binding protein [Halanaerobium saccharolyticum]
MEEFCSSFASESFNFFHKKTDIEKSEEEFGFHIHDLYEIYYFISGDVTYQIEGHGYQIGAGDLLLINNQELHKPVFNSNRAYERMAFHFSPWYFREYSSENYNLLSCFEERKSGHYNRIAGAKIKEHKIDQIISALNDYRGRAEKGKKIMLETLFVQMLYLLNQAFEKDTNYHQDSIIYNQKVTKIIRYINNNLGKNFSLDLLAQKFYLDKYYLSHLFKENTGFSVMQYINYKKIMKARELLSRNYSCGEVSDCLSFGDYSNFYKTFKKEMGIAPSKYQKENSL